MVQQQLHQIETYFLTSERQYEGFKERLENGGPHLPDFGPREWTDVVSKFGAVVIGARNILVAYNVNVDEKDARTAKIAGSLVRTTGRLLKQDDGRRTRIPGMLQMVQGMGLPWMHTVSHKCQ